MPTSDIGLDKTLAALGVTRPEQVSERFATIRAHFDGQFQTVQSESEWKLFRDAWLARKSGVITQITDNWLNLQHLSSSVRSAPLLTIFVPMSTHKSKLGTPPSRKPPIPPPLPKIVSTSRFPA